MKILCLLVLFIAILQFNGCTNTSQKTEKSLVIYHFDDVSKPEEITLSELGIDDIQYIPLETNEKSLIAFIWNVKTFKDKILIDDGNMLSLFDLDGRFVTEIGKQGKGPEEYQICNDFDLFPKSQSFVVLSMLEDKFYWYDYDGKYIKTSPAPRDASNFICSDSTFLCYCENSIGNIEKSFCIINPDGNIVKNFSNKYKYKCGKIPFGFIKEIFFYQERNQNYFKEVLSDTIYQWKDNDFSPSVILDRGDKKMVTKARIVNSPKDVLTSHYFCGKNLFSVKGFMYYSFDYENKTFDAILSQNDGNSLVKYTDKGIVNNVDGGTKVVFKLKISDNEILSWITSLDLKNYVTSDDFINARALYPEKKKALEELANSLKEDDNPVLIVYKVNQ